MTTANRLLVAAILTASAVAYAAEPPTAPILRINTDIHNAVVRALAVNSDESKLITAAEDKTAKVWNLADGTLLHTLRIPIGVGHEGQLRAAALDPQEKWLALAGSTGAEWDGSYSIYLLDPATGNIQRRCKQRRLGA